jgi:DNA-binding Xre family transcriptional regulator
MAKLMNLDKTLLKRAIDKTKPQDLLVLTVNKLEKGSVNTNLKTIEKFINSKDDYVIMVMKR